MKKMYLLGSVLVFPLLALGAENSTNQATTEQAGQEGGVSYRLLAGAAHEFSTNLDSGGDFSLTRYAVAGNVSYPLGSTGLSASHGLLYEYDQYSFSGNAPWNNENTLSYSLNLSYDISKKVSVYGGPIVGFEAESGANWGNAVVWGGMGGFSYHFSNDLSIGAAAVVLDEVGNDVLAEPILTVDWQINKQWQLRNVRPQPGIRGGAGIELGCGLAENLEIAVGGAYDHRRFRLSQNDEIGENDAIPVFARLTYKASESWILSAVAGVNFAGELKLRDSSGNEISSTHYDPAPFVGLIVSYRR
jgi:hypothetical protein